jgi:hypothetical protein
MTEGGLYRSQTPENVDKWEGHRENTRLFSDP